MRGPFQHFGTQIRRRLPYRQILESFVLQSLLRNLESQITNHKPQTANFRSQISYLISPLVGDALRTSRMADCDFAIRAPMSLRGHYGSYGRGRAALPAGLRGRSALRCSFHRTELRATRKPREWLLHLGKRIPTPPPSQPIAIGTSVQFHLAFLMWSPSFFRGTDPIGRLQSVKFAREQQSFSASTSSRNGGILREVAKSL